VRRCWVFAGFEIFAFGCLLAGGKKKEVKKETKLGMAYKKDENFGEWYSEVRWVFIRFVLAARVAAARFVGVLPIGLLLLRLGVGL